MSEIIYLKDILPANGRKKKTKRTTVRRKLKSFNGNSLKSSMVEKNRSKKQNLEN
ncbi:MAG: hypothetical protein LBT90_00040 [Holosporaceae bacterium]|nr:hypothetical protein [Holosporaceae bacterium]